MAAKQTTAFATVLRILSAAAAVSAAVVMATSHETVSVFGLTMEAKFNYLPAFTFFVIANGVAAAYNLLAMFVSPASSIYRLLLVLDVVMEMVLVGALAAAGALAKIGKEGNLHAGWLPICGQVKSYCSHVMGSLIAGFAAVVFYFLLVLISFHSLLS